MKMLSIFIGTGYTHRFARVTRGFARKVSGRE